MQERPLYWFFDYISPYSYLTSRQIANDDFLLSWPVLASPIVFGTILSPAGRAASDRECRYPTFASSNPVNPATESEGSRVTVRTAYAFNGFDWHQHRVVALAEGWGSSLFIDGGSSLRKADYGLDVTTTRPRSAPAAIGRMSGSPKS
jgi:hypothetical protein